MYAYEAEIWTILLLLRILKYILSKFLAENHGLRYISKPVAYNNNTFIIRTFIDLGAWFLYLVHHVSQCQSVG